MIRAWRLPLLAAVCILASRGSVAAQTVIVRHVPEKAAVQVVASDAAPVDAQKGADGNFRATINAIPSGATEISAVVSVDSCDASIQIVVARIDGNPPAIGANCTRRQIAGQYVVRSRTSLVVNLAGQTPSLLTSQGPAPSQWLRDVVVESKTPGATPSDSSTPIVTYKPTGLMVVGAASLSNFRKFGEADCSANSAAGCTIKNTVWDGTAGVEYWLTPYVGAFGSYSKERPATTTGNGGTYSFSSELDTDFSTIGGEALFPVGRVTVFGMIGAVHHRATWTTVNTIQDTTVTVDGVSQTLSGGTETYIVKTQGWNVTFGGGANYWVTNRLGIRGAIDYSFFNGNDLGTSQAKIDDSMLSLKFGVIVRIGKL